METKYGHLPFSTFEKYRKSIVDKIYILIPLKEENCPTLQNYIERLNRELCGMMEFVAGHEDYVLTTICLLENLITEENFNIFKHDVFRCCELISKAYGGEADA